MKKTLLALCMVPAVAWSQQCVLQSRTVAQSAVTIQERTNLTAEVVPALGGGRKCMVNFRARIGAEWHTAFGEYEWTGDRPREQACAIAVKRAEDSVRERVAQSEIASEKVLVCRDNPDLEILRQINPGTVGNLAQFRPHPDRPREFWHNGAPCRYFLHSAYVARDIRTFEGIICRIDHDQWVVVDKF